MALMLSGLNNHNFAYLGYLPKKEKGAEKRDKDTTKKGLFRKTDPNVYRNSI